MRFVRREPRSVGVVVRFRAQEGIARHAREYSGTRQQRTDIACSRRSRLAHLRPTGDSVGRADLPDYTRVP